MRQRVRAQALVEFALVLPLLLALFLGIVDGAFLFQGYLTVAHAANEAARFAVVYQPAQGECLNHDLYGSPIYEAWPNCPSDYAENPSESDADYHGRRVELIKRMAIESTTGLRTTDVCKSLTCIRDHYEAPGMLGVRVWGFQSFETEEEEDRPGLPGLGVRVEVVHNVPLVIFGSFLPDAMVRVSSTSDMINEGIQVGFGNQAPPTFSPPVAVVPPGPGEPPGPGDPPETEEPEPGPPPTPTLAPEYHISLSPKSATNVLPDEREHALTAYVTDDQARGVAGARVTFVTDAGSFQMSGTGGASTVATTGADGQARAVIYANEPLTASIRAFLDYNLNGVPNVDEPSDTASKIWDVYGPYLVVSDHNPEPLAWLAVSLKDHSPSEGPYSLWWCPADSDAEPISAQLQTAIAVDASGDSLDNAVQVPLNVAGVYRIESHRGTGSCGASVTLAAYSAPIEIADAQPDLVIEAVSFVDTDSIAPGLPITIQITVTNQAPVPVLTGPFDVDTYLDLGSPPQPAQLGETKQWLPNLGPNASTVITEVVTVYTAEAHELWLQVDTTGYVDEGESGGEDNNTFGPLAIPFVDCIPMPEYSDDFGTQRGASWGEATFGGVEGSYSVGGGQLDVTSDGSNLGGSGNNNYYYIYQTYSGDIDVRVRVLSVPNADSYTSKIGLQLAESLTASRGLYVMHMATNERSPAGEQAAYRDRTDRAATTVASGGITIPSWLRIRRIGNQYEFFRSAAEDPEEGDWTGRGSVTMNTPLPYFGIAQASGRDNRYRTGTVDEVEVCRPVEHMDVPPPSELLYPPGLVQCTELLSAPGFEGGAQAVFSYWTAGDASGLTGAYQRTSAEFYRGSFSIRLHASNTVVPCNANQLQPYLFQRVTMPDEAFSHSTLVVTGHYFVTGTSGLVCSLDNSPDPDDTLQVTLRDAGGGEITAPVVVATGSDADGRWHTVSTPLHSGMDDPADYAGDDLQVRWLGTNDRDTSGTFFYIDDVSAQLCTEWSVPDLDTDLGTFGGKVTTRGENNVPTIFPGADVWAYTQGTDVLHTRSIHDGTYHFYNVQPGNYIVYAEAWVGGALRTVSASVDVEAGDALDSVNLLLQ